MATDWIDGASNLDTSTTGDLDESAASLLCLEEFQTLSVSRPLSQHASQDWPIPTSSFFTNRHPQTVLATTTEATSRCNKYLEAFRFKPKTEHSFLCRREDRSSSRA